jgi:predicted methyltransferase
MRLAAAMAATMALATLAACATVPPPPPPPPEASIVVPPYVAAALADPGRPKADRDRDAARKPGEVIAWAGIRPGMKVADLIPGGGYFTRIFSVVVGPKGHVYAYVPDELTKLAKRPPAVKAITDDPRYKNVSLVLKLLGQFGAPEKLDVVWTAQNYHDMHDSFMGPADLAVVNRAIFASLKPGGVYIVLDHAAQAGSGLRDTETLHRIDPETVKKEVLAAGFIFEGETKVLRNPKDDKSLKVFDPKVRGETDQFVYKFRKPRSAR